jgi:hypothetical protein
MIISFDAFDMVGGLGVICRRRVRQRLVQVQDNGDIDGEPLTILVGYHVGRVKESIKVGEIE